MHDLLRASTSSQGYHKMTGAIRADDVLHDLNGEALFGAANYYASVFGTPEDANWAWMLTGHHMSAMFTVAGDRTAFTPMFTGSQPLQIPTGVYAGWQVLPQDAARASELLSALFEAHDGEITSRTSIRRKVPVTEYLKLQKRFGHLFGDRPDLARIALIQAIADRNIAEFGFLH